MGQQIVAIILDMLIICTSFQLGDLAYFWCKKYNCDKNQHFQSKM